jgi:hypothetical protein
MPEGIRTMNLRFLEATFNKLEAKKKASGLSWEKWIEKIAGIDE